MPGRRTGQVEAQIAANSRSIRKICNEGLIHFNQQLLINELIRGSLTYLTSKKYPQTGQFSQEFTGINIAATTIQNTLQPQADVDCVLK